MLSVDLRGIEQSNPIRRSLISLHPQPRRQINHRPAAEFEALARANAAFIDSCVGATGS